MTGWTRERWRGIAKAGILAGFWIALVIVIALVQTHATVIAGSYATLATAITIGVALAGDKISDQVLGAIFGERVGVRLTPLDSVLSSKNLDATRFINMRTLRGGVPGAMSGLFGVIRVEATGAPLVSCQASLVLHYSVPSYDDKTKTHGHATVKSNEGNLAWASAARISEVFKSGDSNVITLGEKLATEPLKTVHSGHPESLWVCFLPFDQQMAVACTNVYPNGMPMFIAGGEVRLTAEVRVSAENLAPETHWFELTVSKNSIRIKRTKKRMDPVT